MSRVGALIVFAAMCGLVGIAPHVGSAQPASTQPSPSTTQAPRPGAALDTAPATPKPRVKLFATGGTISNRSGGRLTSDELLASMPGLDRYARGEAEQFSNVSSSELSLGQYLDLSRRISAAFAAEPDLAGVVVTVGTDTLEELAYFLHLTVRDDRPVVLVGSMRNPSTLGYEGAANLLEGFRVAADPASRGMGAVVVLNDEINSARDVTKTDALRLHTFRSPNVGVLGVVDADRVVYYRRPVKRSGARTEFDISALNALPRVDIVLVYQDAPGDIIKAAVDGGARGLVIAGAGAGATSGTQAEALAYARDKQVTVVIGTRTGSGRIASRSRSPVMSPPVQAVTQPVAAEDLTPLKARVLLMLALTRTTVRDEIQRMFEEY